MSASFDFEQIIAVKRLEQERLKWEIFKREAWEDFNAWKARQPDMMPKSDETGIRSEEPGLTPQAEKIGTANVEKGHSTSARASCCSEHKA